MRVARHVTTDPACARHRPPRTWWQRWRFDRGRGVRCPACLPPPGRRTVLELADAPDWDD